MGCRSDYLEPTPRENESKCVAKLLKYVYSQLKEAVSEDLEKASGYVYGNTKELDRWTRELCDRLTLLKSEKPKMFEKIVYNAHDSVSRELAQWWEQHKKEDENRMKNGEKERDQTVLQVIETDLDLKTKNALKIKSKISQKEFEALKDYIIDEWKQNVRNSKEGVAPKKRTPKKQ